MKQQINFKYGTSKDYSQIVPDNQSLYFLTDVNQLIFQDKNYSKGIELVDSLPLEGISGLIYCYNGELYCYQGEWIKLTKNNKFEQLKTEIEELLRGI